MRDLLRDLMDSAAARADYADARFVSMRRERLSTRNGGLHELDSNESEGVGVRVRVRGAWGFAATGGTGRRDVEAALERALAVAAEQPAAAGTGALAPEPPATGAYVSPVERDPFEVSLEDKLAVLLAADAGLAADPGVTLRIARFEALRVHKLFASSDGAMCEQTLTECGGGIAAVAVAVDGSESQVRSFPASHGGQVTQAGYEQFLALELERHAPRVGAEAVALVSAPACPPGRSNLVLAGEQLGLQVHESVGHAVELDRVLGREASYAGTSFVPASGIGSLRFGSERVSVTADATSAGGLGSYRWDDEGVEGRAVPIVREGVLTGFLSSRETAAEIGLERSGGCMRAEGFDRQPIVRMTNVNLDPGDAGTLDDLIADTGEGLLIDTNRSWSIDNRRLQFQFEGEAAWEIRGGERRRLLRNPSYAGVTPEFWRRCDAVCSAGDWRLISLLDCGKGEPGQVARVSHGSAPARFRDVEVGVA
jgi:TldD protein